MQGQLGLREEENAKTRVLVGMATGGIAAGARPVLNELADKAQSDHVKGMSWYRRPAASASASTTPSLKFMSPARRKLASIWIKKKLTVS